MDEEDGNFSLVLRAPTVRLLRMFATVFLAVESVSDNGPPPPLFRAPFPPASPPSAARIASASTCLFMSSDETSSTLSGDASACAKSCASASSPVFPFAVVFFQADRDETISGDRRVELISASRVRRSDGKAADAVSEVVARMERVLLVVRVFD